MRIGMDFGTTNSGIAHYDGVALQLLPLDPAASNPQVARSALYITHDRQLHFGRAAIDNYYQQNLNRPVQLERVYVGEIEQTFAELPTFHRDVYIERDVFSPGRLFLSFKNSLASRGYVGTAVGEDFYLLEDIIALYLYSARRRAEREWGAELREVVLGRPVRYAEDDEQDALAQARMLQAAFLAGYERVHFAYEPVAAAYAYALRSKIPAHAAQTMLVFDFGGGTLDISIVRRYGPDRRYGSALTVLATGGINIAGDTFDSRIVRRKLTAPFGEGSHYLSDGRQLPVPAAYYDAFSSWQDLLALQQPNTLESLRRIARSAEQPARIQSLIRLITSHYGLRLFDIAEAAKRRLSRAERAGLRLLEDGLAFDERLSRREFESLIRSDLRKISARLDEVVAAAGLRPHDIDAVIRTGGSAQIPCFVRLLEERFGAEKVRTMDTFSSVTAGLAVIAKCLDDDLPEGALVSADHTPAKHSPPTYRETKSSAGLPRIQLMQMQQLIDLRTRRRESTANMSWLIGRAGRGQMVSVPLPRELPAIFPLADSHPPQQIPKSFSRTDSRPTSKIPKSFSPPAFALSAPARILPGDERLVLLTSAPRLLAREVSWLHELAALGTTLEEFERFERDAFGEERVCSFSAWSELAGARRLLLLTTRAHAQPLATEHTLQRLRLSAALRLDMPTRAGDPLALLPLHEGGSLILLTSTGRLARLSAADCEATGAPSPTGGALLSLTGGERLVVALMLRRAGTLVVAREDGALRWWESGEVPQAGKGRMTLRAGIARLTAAKGRHALATVEAGQPLWVLTTQRLLAIATRAERIILRRGERLLGFVNG